MTSTPSPSRLSGRTRIITVASIGAVSVASLFAIGANLGILTRADQSDLGTMSAASDLVPVDSRVVDVYLDEQGNPVGTSATDPTGAQRFTVDAAGTVDVSVGATAPVIDRIDAAAGWSAGPVTTTGGRVAVTFTDGTRTLHFAASLAADGTIVADVTETTGGAARASGPASGSSGAATADRPATPAGSGTGSGSGTDDDQDEWDDDSDDHEDEDSDDHEDSEDHEDEDEYEGGDSDD